MSEAEVVRCRCGGIFGFDGTTMRVLADGRRQWRAGKWIVHTEGDFGCEAAAADDELGGSE